MGRLAGIAIIAAVVIAGGVGLYLLLDRGTDARFGELLSAELDKVGGSYESLDYAPAGNVLRINGLTVGPIEGLWQSFRADTLVLTGASASAFENAFDMSGGGGPYHRLFSSLELEGAELIATGGSLIAGRAQLDAPELRPFERAAPTGEGSIDIVSRPTRAEAVGDFLSRLRFQALSFEALTLAPADAAQAPVDAASLRAEGFDGGTLDAFALTGLAANEENGPGAFSVQSARAGDVDAGALVIALATGTLAIDADDPVLVPGWLPVLGETMLEGLAISGAEGTATIERIAMEDLQHIGRINVGGKVRVDAMRIPLEAGEQTQSLRELGYDDVVLNLDYHSSFDDETGVNAIESLTLEIVDMGRLEGDAVFNNVRFYGDLEGMTQREFLEGGMLARILQEVQLGNLTLAYEDASLVDRVMAAGAEEAGLSIEAYTDELVTQLAVNQEAFQGDPFLVSAFGAASDFLRSPGRIELTAAPSEPVSLAQLSAILTLAPLMAARTLNVTVEATPEAQAGEETAPAQSP